ncbi:MAG: hypothetical protein ACR2PJ_05085, partial [Pseudomonadales bacterium]
MNRIFAGVLIVAGLPIIQACSTHYATPVAVSEPVSLDMLWFANDSAGESAESGLADDGNDEIAALINLKPTAKFPARIAVARLQGKERSARLEIIAPGSIEGGADPKWLSRLDMVEEAIPLTEAFAATKLESLKDLRLAAERLGIDLLLVYLIDTEHHPKTASPPIKDSLGDLAMVSLSMGLMWPKKQVVATSTTSGMLLDVPTGFIYGTTESTESRNKRFQHLDTRNFKG